VDAVNKAGDTPLAVALVTGRAGVFRDLLAAGAAAKPLLALATLARSSDIAAKALEQGADPNERQPNGETVMHVAAGRGCVGIVEMLIAAGGDVDARDVVGQTPLHRALEFRDVMATLLRGGASIDARDSSGRTPLAVAVSSGRVETSLTLLDAGADARVNVAGESLAFVAFEMRAFPGVERLLECGADPGLLLHAAARLYVWGVCGMLARRMDVNASDADGDTALHVAARSGSLSARELINLGADLRARNHAGSTPLHAAVEGGSAGAASLLLAAGADAEARDDAGETALDLARRLHSSAELMSALRRGGTATVPSARIGSG
jgi:ankyrin repeat protein